MFSIDVKPAHIPYNTHYRPVLALSTAPSPFFKMFIGANA